jgi:hypothetical protein
MRKSLFVAGVVSVCFVIAVNVFLFLISLLGGPGTQQSFDWFLIFTSFAPAYLPWMIPRASIPFQKSITGWLHLF